MRKVMYSLNGIDDQIPGIFHCWSGTMQNAYALIEDTTTGKMHCVADANFRFSQPPELRKHKMEEGELVEALKLIATKIETLTTAIEGR